MENFEGLEPDLNEGLRELLGLWTEIGIDSNSVKDRKKTVLFQLTRIMNRMCDEEKAFKKRLLDSSYNYSKTCHQLSKEMGVHYEDPDANMSLLEIQNAVKNEATKLEEMKEKRMKEVLKLKSMDEELCTRLCLDPYYISSSTVPTTAQLDGLKDHIKRMEEEKFTREEKFIEMKETILNLYSELEEEPISDIER